MALSQHTGLPGSTVIPDGWTDRHAPTVAATFDCAITISATSAPTFDGTQTTTTATQIYAGPASIGLASATDTGAREAASEQVEARSYEVKVPTDLGDAIRPDHQVLVVSCPNPALAGRTLIVTDIAVPGREFSRVIRATLFD